MASESENIRDASGTEDSGFANPFVDERDGSPFVAGAGYSLESILTEVKSSAIIEGDAKISAAILEAEAERILREVSEQASADSRDDFSLAEPAAPADISPAADYVNPVSDISPAATSTPAPGAGFEPFAAPAPIPEPAPISEPAAEPFARPASIDTPRREKEFINPFSDGPGATADRLISEAYARLDEPEFEETDEVPMIITPAEDEATSVKAKSTAPVPGTEAYIGPASGKPSRQFFAEDPTIINIPLDNYGDDADATVRFDTKKPERNVMFEEAIVPDDEQIGRIPDEEEEFFEEPRLKDQAIKYARTCNSISRRLLPASIITLIMVLMTYVYEAGLIVPFGIGRSIEHAAGTFVLMLLIVMMLCVEVVIRGVDFLIHGNPNAETLVLFSCIFSLTSAVFTVLSGTALMLPFCAVSALSLVFAAYGERSNLRAMTDTLKTAISSAEPYGVQAEYNENLDDSVLKKAYSRTDGFYSNLVQQDITELLYSYAAPILLILALIITSINVLINGVVENSLHILSALLAAAAPFSLLLAYPLPFSIVTRAVGRVGVALAGWGGADEIAHTDGVCVTDDDLFPEGTLRLGSIKVFDGAPQNNVLCYTASLIIASGSGLANLFAEALNETGIRPVRVANFECHESGVSGIVQGNQIASGSAAHMNLIGVRVPDDSNMRNAIFTAVNNRLVAMFTIDYKPLPSVQKALIALLRWRIDLYFAMRDFNITPSMVGQKFKVPFESFVFMPVKESYAISDPYSGKQGRMASILVRESLVPYAEAITSARLLRSASIFASILSVISAGLGLLLMFLMLWDGSFNSATPGNLILYMLAMLAAVLLVCGYVKVRK